MKKIFLLLILCCTISIQTFSQKNSIFYLNAGVGLFAPWNYHNDAVFFPAFTLTPGVKFYQEKDFAIILNFPISGGVTYKSDAFIGIDLPAMLSLNFGSAAGNNKESKLGFVVAAGAGYLNVVNDYDKQINKRNHIEFWGYRFNAGVSFKNESGIIPSIIISYGKSISSHNGNVVGIGLQLIITDI